MATIKIDDVEALNSPTGTEKLPAVDGLDRYSVTIDTLTQYVAGNHDHAGVYSPVAHNHAGVYAPVVHNHDGVYATAAQGALAASAVQPGDAVSDLANDAGYLTSAPVTSVDGKTGAVSLSADYAAADHLHPGVYATAAQGAVADTAVQPGDNITSLLNNAGFTTLGLVANVHYTKTQSDARYATIAQGSLADTAVQPGDNVSDLANNAGYLTAEADPVYLAQKGAPNGCAPLGADSLVPQEYLPPQSTADFFEVASQAAQLALTVAKGDFVIRTDENKVYVALNADNVDMGDWLEWPTPSAPVASVDGRTGAVTLGDLYATAAQGAKADSALQSGANISLLNNNAGYTTLAAVALAHYTKVQSDAAYATAAQGATADSAVQPGDGVNTLTNDAGYITLAGAAAVHYTKTQSDARYAAIAHNHTGVYATAAQGALAATAVQPNDNISALVNDAGYITGYTVTEADVTAHEGALDIGVIPAPASMTGYQPAAATVSGHLTGIANKLQDKLPTRGALAFATKTGSPYILTLNDVGYAIGMDLAGANTVTLDTEANQGYPVGVGYEVWRLGAGQTTIQAAAGVTLNGVVGGSVVISQRYQAVFLRRVAADNWVCTVPG